MEPLLNIDDANEDDHYIKDVKDKLYNFNCGICYEDYNLKDE